MKLAFVVPTSPSVTDTSFTLSYGAVIAGSTNRVTLWAGRLAEKLWPERVTSGSRLIWFEEVRRKACATPLEAKLDTLKLAGVVPDRTLLTTIRVSAPSAVRWAAKTAVWSGSGP